MEREKVDAVLTLREERRHGNVPVDLILSAGGHVGGAEAGISQPRTLRWGTGGALRVLVYSETCPQR